MKQVIDFLKQHNKATLFLLLLIIAITLLILYTTYLHKNNKIHFQTPVIFLSKPKLSYVLGENAHIIRGRETLLALAGMALKEKDIVEVGEKTKLDLRLNESYAVRLSDFVKMEISAFNLDNISMKLDRGALSARFGRILKTSSTKIYTPTAIAAVRGTDFHIQVNEDKSTELYVLKGLVEIAPIDDEANIQIVPEGHKTSVFTKEDEAKLSTLDPILITEDEIKGLRQDINNIRFEIVLISLDNVRFDSGTSRINKKSFKVLDEAAQFILENRDISKIRVDGHTDDVGSKKKNQKLSEKRAQAIKNYLIKKGVKESILSIKGWGELKPITDNSTAKGRLQNRRVEFVVVE